jgi:hypothetical protein
MNFDQFLGGLSQQFIVSAVKTQPDDAHPQGAVRVQNVISVATGFAGVSTQSENLIPIDSLQQAIDAARKAGDTHGVSVLEACIAA